MQHLLVTFRTKVIARYDIELDMDGAMLNVRVESDTGGLHRVQLLHVFLAGISLTLCMP